jgi:hypothetical protein
LAVKRIVSADDQEFTRAVGLDSNDLEWLVKDAPAVAPAVRDRIRCRVHEGVAPQTAPAPARRRPWTRVAAAAAILLAVSGTALVAGSAEAREKIMSLFRLVPNLGITATDEQSRALAAPLQIASAGTDATILAAVAGPESTQIRLRINGLEQKPGLMQNGSLSSNPPVLRPEFPAELVLPDGERLIASEIQLYFEKGTLNLTVTFGAVPPGTTSFRLEMPKYKELALGVSAEIPLSKAAAVALQAAEVSGAATEHAGIKVEAHHYAIDNNLVRVSMGITPVSQGLELDHTIGYKPEWVGLTDDTGRGYTFSVVESDLLFGPNPAYNVAFAGPLAPGARQLTLTVPELYVAEEGSATVDLDLSGLEPGHTQPVNAKITVGAWPVTVKSVERKADGPYTLRVDLGPAGGDRYLSHVSVLQGAYSTANGIVGKDRVQTLALPQPGPDGKLTVTLGHPVVTVTGPWVVNVPLKQ